MKQITLASASVVAMIAASAHAQTAPAPAASGEAIVLEEIIVTAQRTEQSSQKAALPISVIRPDDLVRQNVSRPEDLSRLVPALIGVNSGGANATFFLRGVGNFTANSYSDPAIAFNYDGVYIGRPTNVQGLFYDLQRVEVLKGPQGTLYGRNATGGAVNVMPARPALGETGGDVQIGYGNYNALQAQGALNVAIGESSALRIAGTYSNRDGYLSDGGSDQKLSGVRTQFLTDITPDITTRFAADYAHSGGRGIGSFQYGTTFFNGTGYGYRPAPGLDASIGLHDPRSEAFLQQQFLAQVGRNAEALNSTPSLDNSFSGITNETSWSSSVGTLTVQAAYRQGDIKSVSTSSSFRANITDEENEQYSGEARFAGTAGPVDYLVGGYYFKEEIDAHLAINQLLSIPFQDYVTSTESKAGFGRLAYRITPTITLAAAGRYTDDAKKFDGVSDTYILNCGNTAPPQDFCPTLALLPVVRTAAELRAYYQARGIQVRANAVGLPMNTPYLFNARIPISSTADADKFTYRLAADWQATPDSMLYASYETGFRGGGFSFARGLESYEPEEIEAYTVGTKNRFIDNRLQVNAELFYWKYKNQQFSQFGFDLGTPPATVFFTSNVGRSTNKGVDVDVDFLATSMTRLSGSVQYLDTEYSDFTTYSPILGTTPPNTACPYTPTTFNGRAAYAVDCSGRPGFNAPKWSFNVNIAQTIELAEHQLVLQGGTRYRSSYFVAPTYQPWLLSKGAFQSDASITFSPYSDDWFLSAYVNNIENKRRLAQVGTNNLGTQTGVTGDPRTFGIRAGQRF